jgi:hypothetical protein
MEESKGHGSSGTCGQLEQIMLDLLMAVFTVGFFAVALAYVKACEKLR